MLRLAMDANALAFFLSDGHRPPDSARHLPYHDLRQRIMHITKGLEVGDIAPIIVPSPAYSEVLSVAPHIAQRYAPLLDDPSVFQVVPFGQLAAFRLSELNTQNHNHGHADGMPWQKVKFDRQILACAEIADTQIMLTDDQGMQATCTDFGLEYLGVENWPIGQTEMFA